MIMGIRFQTSGMVQKILCIRKPESVHRLAMQYQLLGGVHREMPGFARTLGEQEVQIIMELFT